jgi:amidophosphoribosyltransferase
LAAWQALTLFHCVAPRYSLQVIEKNDQEPEGEGRVRLAEYANDSTNCYHAMVEHIGKGMGVLSLQYQKLEQMIKAIGITRDKVCTFCWNGCE